MGAAIRSIQDLESEQPAPNIVLDLRNNPGGYLTEALRGGSRFIDESAVIVHERNADEKLVTYRARGPGLARDLPLIVLIRELGIQPDVVVEQALSVELIDAYALEAQRQQDLYRHPDRQFTSALMLMQRSIRQRSAEKQTERTTRCIGSPRT